MNSSLSHNIQRMIRRAHPVRRVNPLSLLLVAIMAALAGCGSPVFNGDLPPGMEKDGPWIYLTLDVKTAEPLPSGLTSRAGNINENYFFQEPERQNEKLNNLAVIITDNAGTVEATRNVSYSPTGTVLYDNLTFQLKPGQKKIYLIGNYLSLPAEVQTQMAALKTGEAMPAAFAITQNTENITLSRGQNEHFYTLSQNIPMTECFDITLQPNDKYVTADLFVTRIAVKYTIMCADDLDIIKIKLYDLATRQYLMPVDLSYSPAKGQPEQTINGISGRNITSFTPPALLAGETAKSVTEIELTGKTLVEITDDEGNKSNVFRYDPFYLMESPGNNFRISAQGNFLDEKGNEITGEWLPEALLPNLPLLPRNTHVVVTMSAKADLKCFVDLVPYRGCTLDPYFGINRDPDYTWEQPEN